MTFYHQPSTHQFGTNNKNKDNVLIKEAKYVGSFPTVSQCPADIKPEYAFIGRSNVGKSSLINMLCGQKNLARTSNKPGKTQHINYYDIDKSWYLVDLPGYGYAKISKKKRHEWRKMIENYLLRRETLQCAFQLIDINVPPQPIDLEFINWMGMAQIPFILVFTKADKKKGLKNEESLALFKQEMLKTWEALPQYFVTSSSKGEGGEGILELIRSVNERYYDGL